MPYFLDGTKNLRGPEESIHTVKFTVTILQIISHSRCYFYNCIGSEIHEKRRYLQKKFKKETKII
jgi:hypothetical protein